MKEFNQDDKAAVAVGILNTVTYSCVAIMSQLTRIILDAFSWQVNVINKIIVYPHNAYVALFTILATIALIPLALHFSVVKPMGKIFTLNETKEL